MTPCDFQLLPNMKKELAEKYQAFTGAVEVLLDVPEEILYANGAQSLN